MYGVYVTNRCTYDMWLGLRKRDMRGYVCVRVCGVEACRNGFSNFTLSSRSRIDASTRRHHPSLPGSVETPLGELNFRSMCGMFVYGCDLLAPREVRLPSCRGGRKWIRTGGRRAGWGTRVKFVDFEPSERGEFVDIPPRHPMYREPSWKLARNTTGRGR